MPIRSISSHLMTHLLTWRNPQGSEENWVDLDNQSINFCSGVFKGVVTEIGLFLLSAISVVESIAYSIFIILSTLLIPVSSKPLRFFAKCLQSSSFTFIWSLSNAFVFNLFFINIMTHESFARSYAAEDGCIKLPLYRLEDEIYMINWVHVHRPQAQEIDFATTNSELIQQGADCLKEAYVLLDADSQAKFLETDPEFDLLAFVTPIVNRYVSGDRASEAIPDFFRQSTRDGILRLREKDTTISLASVAGNEFRGMLVKSCWKLATQQLAKKSS